MERREFFRRSGAGLLVPAAGLALRPAGLLLPAAAIGALFSGSAKAVTTDNVSYGSSTALTVTNLHSLANDTSDPFTSWQSATVDNRSTLADDYLIAVHLAMANTAAANDKAIYVYLIPWHHDGSAWVPAGNFSTTTAPTGSEGTASMSEPNSMKGPLVLPYITQQQNVDGFFTVAQMCGGVVPDGWSVAIRNCSGANLAASGSTVRYRAITYTNG